MSLLKNTSTVLIGAAILSLVAFVNGYPLVYSDTGTYIMSGREMWIPIDRPIAYGLFIRLFGSVSLWTVIIAQNILTSYILFEAFRLFFPIDKKFRFYFFGTIGLLTFLTGISYYTNQLMPDFLTALMILGIFILCYAKNLGSVRFIAISLLVIFCIITHFSHLLIASGLAVAILCYHSFLFRKRLAKHALSISLKKALLVMVIACSGWLVLPTLNWIISGEFYQSKSSHIFFMGSMADKGILQQFLKDECGKPEWSDCKMCQYKNEIPQEVAVFLWDGGDSSVFMKTGGWMHSKTEYNKIIHATLVNPKYSSQHVYKAIAYGLTQLFENRIGEGLGRYRENSSPWANIISYYRIEFNMYMNSKQNRAGGPGLNLEILNNINLLLLMFCVLYTVYIYFSPAREHFDRMTVWFLTIMLLGIVMNSMVTAGLSAPYGRYQTRVVWLMELAIIIFSIKNSETIKGSVYTVFKRPG